MCQRPQGPLPAMILAHPVPRHTVASPGDDNSCHVWHAPCDRGRDPLCPARRPARVAGQTRWRPHRRAAWPRVDPWRWRRRRAARNDLMPCLSRRPWRSTKWRAPTSCTCRSMQRIPPGRRRTCGCACGLPGHGRSLDPSLVDRTPLGLLCRHDDAVESSDRVIPREADYASA